MARDYAKRSKSRRNSASTGGNNPKRRISPQRSKSDYGNTGISYQGRSILPWLIFICIALMVTTGFLIYKIHKDSEKQPPATPLAMKKSPPAKKPKRTTPPTQANSLQLDFYTMLPSMKVGSSYKAPPPIPTPTQAQQKQPATPKPTPSVKPQQTVTNKPSTRYIVQVASVKRAQDADRLKAQLTLAGFDVSIKQVIRNGQTWNRVYMGPFSSLTGAKNIQTRLKQFQINSILSRSSG